ncbi:hypothetical protein Tco_0496635 [Tanacetum coccineum]
MGLHTTEEMESTRFGAYWAESARQIPDKGDLSAYLRGISYEGDFLGTAPSYTTIKDPILRLCHRLLTEEDNGLTVMDQDLPVIDMAKMVAEGAPNINKGAQAVPAPIQAPQPHLQLDLLGLYHRGWLDWRRRYMGCERHWASRERYTSYSKFWIPYQRRVRCRTSEASTSVAPLDEDQPDP